MLNRDKLVLLALAGALVMLAGPCWGQATTPDEVGGLVDVTEDADELDSPARPQPTAAATTQPDDGPQPPMTLLERLRGQGFIFIMLGGFILLYFWMSRSRRKQESKRKEMLASLSKGDKVTSIGGIVGTIIEVREDEVTVKVDETNNIRMKFARWAIRGVGDEAKTKAPEQK